MNQSRTKILSGAELGSPPFLLKSLSEPWAIEDSRKNNFGTRNYKLKPVSDNIHICIGGISKKVMKEIELENYVVRTPTVSQIRRIKKGIDILKSKFPDFYNIVNSNLSLIALLQTTKKNNARFASSSYFQFPYCIFLQDFAFRYFPPNSLLPISSNYPFLDNLLHEAIHQRIFNLDFINAICKCYSEDLVVQIPWRQTYWSFYHAFHSYAVYVILSEFRMEFLRSNILAEGERVIIEKSLFEVNRIVKTLFIELQSQKKYFTTFGKLLFKQFKLKQDQLFD